MLKHGPKHNSVRGEMLQGCPVPIGPPSTKGNERGSTPPRCGWEKRHLVRLLDITCFLFPVGDFLDGKAGRALGGASVSGLLPLSPLLVSIYRIPHDYSNGAISTAPALSLSCDT
jgi:hypothetical protein